MCDIQGKEGWPPCNEKLVWYAAFLACHGHLVVIESTWNYGGGDVISLGWLTADTLRLVHLAPATKKCEILADGKLDRAREGRAIWTG